MKFYYFVDKEGVRQGPLPLDDLSAYNISPTTLVWTKGMKKWMKAKDVSDFHSILLHSQDANDIDSATVSPTETSKNSSDVPLGPSENNDIDEATIEEAEKTSYQKYWIIGAVIILIISIVFLGNNKTRSATDTVDTLSMDSVSELAPVDEEEIVKDFLVNMYNNHLYEEYRFLENHCTRHLLDVLRADYEYDGTGYAVWDFRTSSQDEKPDSELKNKIISVESLGDGWYTYEFYDGGWRGKKRVKASVVNGEVMMDVLETLYDECKESLNAEISKDWHLSGYMESNDTRYPILITFHQQGDYYSDCVYKNVTYGGRLNMTVSMNESYLHFEGRDGNKEFVIKLEQNEHGNGWDGYSTIGEQTLFTHLEE
ncbi:MAG: DUF4339 domain-containing protein [Prevotella sp.]|nr:DUF4339 domain-containing protein [Prevotella sp.]